MERRENIEDAYNKLLYKKEEKISKIIKLKKEKSLIFVVASSKELLSITSHAST